MFVLLSFIVNRRINLENNEKNIDKKNIDIDSESKRIYDSLIK